MNTDLCSEIYLHWNSKQLIEGLSPDTVPDKDHKEILWMCCLRKPESKRWHVQKRHMGQVSTQINRTLFNLYRTGADAVWGAFNAAYWKSLVQLQVSHHLMYHQILQDVHWTCESLNRPVIQLDGSESVFPAKAQSLIVKALMSKVHYYWTM